MPIDPNYLIERNSNKRQIFKWKIFSLIMLVIGLLAIGKLLSPKSHHKSGSETNYDHIASVRIEEIILDDLDRIKIFESISKNDKIKALIVNINSPGGSTVGSEMLYNAILKISEKKPVVAIMNSLAASGGYMIALAANHIIAHNGTITGSIGVIIESAEVTELAEKLGIKFQNFKSHPLKATPNPTEKLTDEAYQATMESIYSVYDFFAELVSTRRKIDINEVKKIADGRIYSGRQALKLNLIDEIGNLDNALEYIYKQGVPRELEVIDTRLKPKEKLIDLILNDFESRFSNYFHNYFNANSKLMLK